MLEKLLICHSCLQMEHSTDSWDAGNVTDMNSMFASATQFNGDLTSWDVGNVRWRPQLLSPTPCGDIFRKPFERASLIIQKFLDLEPRIESNE
jgi:hypothetical protein